MFIRLIPEFKELYWRFLKFHHSYGSYLGPILHLVAYAVHGPDRQNGAYGCN